MLSSPYPQGKRLFFRSQWKMNVSHPQLHFWNAFPTRASHSTCWFSIKIQLWRVWKRIWLWRTVLPTSHCWSELFLFFCKWPGRETVDEVFKCNSACLFLLPSPSLVVQLARDLQTDFYPHFPDFFILITSLLDTKDTELLEWAFTCLSYLYKYLWRVIVKDMSNIYRWELKFQSS